MKKRKIVMMTSIIGFVLLAVISFSYAYISLRVLGNNKAKGVERTVGGGTILFNDLTTKNDTVISPGYTTYMKFTVQNLGGTYASYYIYLVDVVNTFTRKQDIVYTLYKKEGENSLDEGEVSNCSNISGCEQVTTGQFPSEKQQIGYSQTINGKYNTYTYILKIEYKKTTENQDADQGHIFGGRIEISGSGLSNPFSKGTLANAIYDSASNTTNGTSLNTTTTTTFTGVSSSTEKNLRVAEDDYGKSYYYRGAVTDNYVSFAGFTWRIVRINGDGSVRLILDGITSKVKKAGETSVSGSSTFFNSGYNSNAYVGYMYGTPSSTTYDKEQEFVGDKSTYNPDNTSTTGHSNIKIYVDRFYKKYLLDYSDYLSDEIFCGDKTLASTKIGNVTTQYGYGSNTTYYAATERLVFSSGTTLTTSATPTLKCAESANNDYSRYTVNVQYLKNGKKTNGDLTYPIALLSADELVMAGAFEQKISTFYLYNSTTVGTGDYWWTMTPSKYIPSHAYGIRNGYNYSMYNHDWLSNGNYGVRPVINLKPGIELLSGNGTSSNPYKVSGYDLN